MCGRLWFNLQCCQNGRLYPVIDLRGLFLQFHRQSLSASCHLLCRACWGPISLAPPGLVFLSLGFWSVTCSLGPLFLGYQQLLVQALVLFSPPWTRVFLLTWGQGREGLWPARASTCCPEQWNLRGLPPPPRQDAFSFTFPSSCGPAPQGVWTGETLKLEENPAHLEGAGREASFNREGLMQSC